MKKKPCTLIFKCPQCDQETCRLKVLPVPRINQKAILLCNDRKCSWRGPVKDAEFVRVSFVQFHWAKTQ